MRVKLIMLTKDIKTMRQIAKNKFTRLFQSRKKFIALVTAGILLISGSITYTLRASAATCSSASDCQQQINSLNNQTSQSQQSVSALQSQAISYQSTISQLQSQIDTINSQIAANQEKQASLQQQMQAAQTQLTQQKAILGADIKAMYVDGQMSTVEELATSKSLSDFVDADTYRSAVQGEVQSTLTQITTLENQVKSQQTQISQLLQTQQSQQTQLNAAEGQQAQLLSYNESQQTQYNQQIASANANIAQLQASLSTLNDAGTSTVISSGVCGGGYPAKAVNPYNPGDGFGPYWGCNYAQDGSEDNWHMENRECVSYTAYKAFTLYGVSTSNWGDAYQWITAAESHGYLVNQTPAVGAIAIRDIDYSEPGDVGHAMYVVAVNGSDSITVDEYNEHYNGQFDERQFAPSSYASRGGLYYIHFQ
jgi:surface antigen/peptidoglycan hydrolase CwlO-like protein